MADEQASVFTASRPDSERSHTLKAHGKCAKIINTLSFILLSLFNKRLD